MSTPLEETQRKGWRAMTPEERAALTPVERAVARLRDADAKRAAERRRLNRLQKLESEADRKRDARRKIVIGVAIEAWSRRTSKAGSDRVKWLRDVLDGELTRDDDRALVGLPPRAADSVRDETTDVQEDSR